jgi:two-component system, cell cycle sensor histidine kinase and response regulator CckA
MKKNPGSEKKVSKTSDQKSSSADIAEFNEDELKIHPSEEKFKDLANSIDDIFFALDRDLNYTYWNDICARLLNMAPETMIGKSFYDFEFNRGYEWIADIYKEVIRTGESQSFEADYRKGDRISWYDIKAYPTNSGCSVIVKDITDLKQAELALRESEATARALLDAPEDIILLFDTNGILLDVNETAVLSYTKSREELIGRCVWDLFPGDVAESRKFHVNKVIQTGEAVRFEDEREGTWFDNVLYPIFDNQQNVTKIAVIARNITERIKAEEQIKVSERNLRKAQEVAHIGSWYLDIVKNKLEWSDEIFRIFGLSPGKSLTYEEFLERVHPDDREIVDKAWTAALNHETYDIKHRILVNNEVKWVRELAELEFDDKGKALRGLGTVQDITERKKAEKAVRERQEFINALIDTSQEWIWAIDLQGNHTFCNPAVESILGQTSEDMVGHNSLNLMHEEDRKTIEQLLPEWIEKKCGWTNLLIRWKHKDGSWRYLESNSVPILDSDNNLVGFRGVDRDITERKKTEEALRKSEEKFFKVFHSSPDSIALTSLETGQFAEVNKGFERMFGYSRDEVLGKTTMELGIWRRSADREQMVTLFEQNGMVRDNEWEYCTKSGKIITCLLSAELIELKGKHYILSVAHDITERKKAEKALQESEEHYRIIIEHANEIFFIVGPTSEIIFVTPQTKEILGYKPDEMMRSSWIDYLTDNPLNKKGTDITQEVIEKGIRPNLFSLEFFHKNGKRVILEIDESPLLDDKGKTIAITGAARDITERKKAEIKIKESEEQYRTLFESSVDALAIHNAETGKYIECNEATLKLHGVESREHFLKLTPADLSPEFQPSGEPSSKLMKEHLQKAFETGGDIFEWVHIKKDGTLSHTSVSLSAIKIRGEKQVLAIVRDISESKKAEEALQESQAFNEILLNSSPDIIYIFDIIEKRTVYSNKGTMKVLGYSVKDIQDMGENLIGTLMHPEDLAYYLKETHNRYQMAKDGELIEHEFRMKHKDGSWRLLIARESIFQRQSDGTPKEIFGVVSDITETKRLRDLASRASRLEMAGTLAGQVAHDFNNLLGPIMAYPEFIRESLPEDHEALTFLDDIEVAAGRIAEINQDLLTLGRRGHYEQTSFIINDVVRQAVKELEAIAHTVTVNQELNNGLMMIQGGPAQIHRMLTNLLSNALDAMQNVGQITIKTENYYADDVSIAFERVPKGEYVKLTLSDTGCGIPKENMQKILEPFFSTKTADKERGSGLGLSVVDAVIKDHDGYLDISSQVGHGTSFYVYFPVCREELEGDTVPSLAKGSEYVLIVDDDELQRKVSLRILESAGYKVSAVESGQLAVDFLKETSCDILVLDMVMPNGIDGTETYRRILEENPHQKAIIVSGYSESDRVSEARQLGAGAFVKKPHTKSSLTAAVREELDRETE